MQKNDNPLWKMVKLSVSSHSSVSMVTEVGPVFPWKEFTVCPSVCLSVVCLSINLLLRLDVCLPGLSTSWYYVTSNVFSWNAIEYMYNLQSYSATLDKEMW